MAAHKARRRWLIAAAIVGGLILLGFVPEPSDELPEGAGQTPFVWGQDEAFASLERRFVDTKERGCEIASREIDARHIALDETLLSLQERTATADDTRLETIETELFELSARVAACPEHAETLLSVAQRVREAVKEASRGWDLNQPSQRARLYRTLYGTRAAVEEVLLQMEERDVPPILAGVEEPSHTPFALVEGVRVHSGDIMISRGGAPTSALIARGSDYPGNFSHIALAHVDEDGNASVIESHIETGVVVSTVEQYLTDTKLRILLLRPRADLPQLVADPMLPHRAAEHAMAELRRRHIPYDFEMDFRDPEEQFCSEVASAAYAAHDVELWEGLTTMSSGGVTRWLSQFGVEHFETHGPSDLEYDPKLRVVVEWRDPQTLFSDHVDNAVVDVMLEGAEEGDDIGYDRHLLPVARTLKAYSVVLNLFGSVGPIPEGMSATVALRAERLRQRHASLKDDTLERVSAFEQEHGYRPPYWELVRLARGSSR